jgi:multiple sugar transport system permease protein
MQKQRNMRWLSDRHAFSEQLSGWLFVLPMLGLFVFFFGWPIIKTVCYLGFTKYGMIGEPQWIGLANYQKLFFQDLNAKSVLYASIRIPLMLIPIHVVLSLPLAWLVFSCRSRLARSVARTTLYVPTLVTTGAVAVAWNFIFSTDNGPLNYVLQQLGLIETKIPWLIKSEYAMWAIVIFSAWKFIGLYFLYYYVGMQNIPESYYEAARIDGANVWQQFRSITLPMLSPTISFVLIIVMTGALQAFDEPYFITSGGPGYFTTNATLYIYRKAFKSYEMGYSAAISTILFIAVFVLTTVQQWLQKRWVVHDFE